MGNEFKPMLKPMEQDSGPEKPNDSCQVSLRQLSEVPGFFGRLGALIIDMFLLSIVARTAGSLGFEFLYPLRHITQPAALLLIFVYFWIGSSALTRGQTLGKWVFGYRVVSRTGGLVSLDKAGIRAIGVFAIVFCYILIWPLLGAVVGRPSQTLLVHMTSLEIFLFLEGCRAVTAAFAMSTVVYCSLHPLKLSLHDLLAGTAVIRTKEEERAHVFLNQEEDEPAYAKRRLARYPAILVAIITLFFLGMGSFQLLDLFRDYLPPVLEARKQLQVEGFTLTNVAAPSTEYAKKFDGQLKDFRENIAKAKESGDAARAETMRDSLTSDSLRLMMNGKKYHFLFECDEIWTSETLTADARYREILDTLPGVVKNLRANVEVREGQKIPTCEGIQMEFSASLPMALHTEMRMIWSNVLPWDEPSTETLVAP